MEYGEGLISQSQRRSFRRINIGCGISPTPGWDNYDNSWGVWLSRHAVLSRLLILLRLLTDRQKKSIQWHRLNPMVEQADATKRIPADDCSVEILYASHMVEHLDGDELAVFLGEALRVLVPRGILRIAVPDLSRLVEQYVASGDADELMRQLRLTRSRPKTLLHRLQWLVLGPRDHMWMYDGPSLCRAVSKNGFQEPIILAPGETTIPEPGALDLFERRDESVYVEARKPEF